MKPVKCICGREPEYEFQTGSYVYNCNIYWCPDPHCSEIVIQGGNQEIAISKWNKWIAKRWENAEKKYSGEIKCDCGDKTCSKKVWTAFNDCGCVEFWVRTKSGEEDLFYLTKEEATKLISQLQFRLKQLEKEQVKEPDWRWIEQRLPYCPECINHLESKMVDDHIQYTCVNKDCDYVYTKL